MKRYLVAGTLLLAFSFAASGQSAAAPRIGACNTFDSGNWSTHGELVFVDCLSLIQQQGDGHLGIGSWLGAWIAQDGLGVMTSHDQGRTWQAYVGRAPEPVAEEQALQSAEEIPARAATEPWPPPTAAVPTQAERPTEERSMASASELPPDLAPKAEDPGAETVTPSATPLNETLSNAKASSRAVEPVAVSTDAVSDPTAPAGTAAEPAAPVEHAKRAPDECRIRVAGGWIKSKAPTLKDCAKLLDQSPENYDSEGYKYAYWQDALLVATKFDVFTFDDAAQWIRVVKRYRY